MQGIGENENMEESNKVEEETGVTESDIASLESLGLKPEEGQEVPDYEGTIKVFQEGDIVKGTVVKVDKDEVLLDIGYKSEGVIPARELSIRYDVKPGEIVNEGDELDALVLQKEDKEGRLILSKKRAQYERSWNKIEETKKKNETVVGDVIEIVKGGLILDIGLRGFLPASLVDLRRVRDLNQFMGQELECKIIEMDRNRNNVVLSRRAHLETAKSVERKEFLDQLKPGMKKTGTISSIVNFGAFVDLGGIDGLIHISELSWSHVDHPSEVVNVEDEVDVEILDVDRTRERVSLSLKKTQEDPWAVLSRESPPGSTITGKVTKLVPFGAFVEIKPGIEGLVHISELAWERVEFPEEVVAVGDKVEAKIIDINLDRRRISLSLKQMTVPEEGEEYPEEKEKEEPELVAAADLDTQVIAEVPTAEKVIEEVVETDEKPSVEAPIAPVAEVKTEVEVETAETAEAEAPEVTEPPPEAEAEIEEEKEVEEVEIDAEPGSLEYILEDMKKDQGQK